MSVSSALTVTAKGQITLRRGVLSHLGAAPGCKVDVALLPDGRVELRASDTAPPLSRLRGALRRPGQPVLTLGAMQDAIEGGDPA